MTRHFDVVAFAAHPDDLEVVMGGTAAKLVRKGLSVLFVDLCDGEPARYAPRGERGEQAARAAEILGVARHTLPLQDRLFTTPSTAGCMSPGCCASIGRAWCSRRLALVFTPTTRQRPTL